MDAVDVMTGVIMVAAVGLALYGLLRLPSLLGALKTGENDQISESMIDLHGYKVHEVEGALLQQIESLGGRQARLTVIVGRGSHSFDGLPKLKPEVKRLATKWTNERRYNCKVESVQNNPGRLRLDFS
eukprot:m.306969 g.306969  ORF g.306969 m.306969 type:complete len:128 (+) comp41788_c0_seq1:61-444(+)